MGSWMLGGGLACGCVGGGISWWVVGWDGWVRWMEMDGMGWLLYCCIHVVREDLGEVVGSVGASFFLFPFLFSFFHFFLEREREMVPFTIIERTDKYIPCEQRFETSLEKPTCMVYAIDRERDVYAAATENRPQGLEPRAHALIVLM